MARDLLRKKERDRLWREANRERDLHLKREWRERNPGYRRAWGLRALYGITVEAYESMLAEQGGGCALCGAVPDPTKKSFPVDHNHETGEVRAILCHPCNTLVGFAEHPRLQAAQAYIAKWNV